VEAQYDDEKVSYASCVVGMVEVVYSDVVDRYMSGDECQWALYCHHNSRYCGYGSDLDGTCAVVAVVGNGLVVDCNGDVVVVISKDNDAVEVVVIYCTLMVYDAVVEVVEVVTHHDLHKMFENLCLKVVEVAANSQHLVVEVAVVGNVFLVVEVAVVVM
jgi:hypothetical protein